MQPDTELHLKELGGGNQTIEGYRSGAGKLIILHENGEKSVFEVDAESEGSTFEVKVGEIMQWQASSDLELFEVCFPPYADGRFEDLGDFSLLDEHLEQYLN